jgi:hypothetical protein
VTSGEFICLPSPIVITVLSTSSPGTDPVICRGTVQVQITGSSPLMTTARVNLPSR